MCTREVKKRSQRGGEGGVSGGICDSMDKLRNEYIRGTAQVWRQS